MNVIIFLWIYASLTLGIFWTLDDFENYFFREAKWKLEKLKINIFGKIIISIFFIPYVIIYGIIYGIMKIMTWHPKSKN